MGVLKSKDGVYYVRKKVPSTPRKRLYRQCSECLDQECLGSRGLSAPRALTGHSGGGVGRTYGAKQMVHRFGIRRLTDAVAKVQYRGLDLSHLYVAKAFD